jgi:enoyl-CoA hydratase/carnithine racemase
VAAALGERRTLELALTGRIFGPQEAREMVLAHEIAADPAQRAGEIARTIGDYSLTAVQSGLGFVRDIRGVDLRSAGEIAQVIRNQLFEGEDFKEGIRAFREKRRPQWPSVSKVQL